MAGCRAQGPKAHPNVVSKEVVRCIYSSDYKKRIPFVDTSSDWPFSELSSLTSFSGGRSHSQQTEQVVKQRDEVKKKTTKKRITIKEKKNSMILKGSGTISDRLLFVYCESFQATSFVEPEVCVSERPLYHGPSSIPDVCLSSQRTTLSGRC